MKWNPGDAIPTGVLLAYGIYHYPISVHPEHVIERYDRMTNDAGELVEVTLATEKIYDRELCESGVDNRKLASTMSFVSRSDDVFARGSSLENSRSPSVSLITLTTSPKRTSTLSTWTLCSLSSGGPTRRVGGDCGGPSSKRASAILVIVA